MNNFQKAITWLWQKAIGFPAWNLSNQAPQAYRNFFNGGNELTRLSTVYTCCNLLGRRVATLPIDIVESDGEISKPVDNYIGGLLSQPNEYMNKVEFLEALLLSLNLRGNGYAEIVRIGNRITALWPLPYERVKPRWENQSLWYDVSLPDGKVKPLIPRDVLHVRNFSFDGINGLTPIQLHAVKRGIAAADFQESFLKNGARPSIAFSSPEKPVKEAQERARETAENLYSGTENAGKIMFLWGGMTASTISVSPADAQLIEGMRMTDAEIAAAYGVPLNLLNQTDKSATYASAEQFNRYFVDYTLDPLCQRVAAALTRSLLNPRLGVSVKFNLDALLAGNSIDRANYLRTLVAAGLMKPNEARAKLNLPPAAGGDDLITQTNQAPLQLLGEVATAGNEAAPKTGDAAMNKTLSGVDWNALTEAVNNVRWKASMQ